MNGPLKMYQANPIVRHDFSVTLPDCMYKQKNIHQTRNGEVDRSGAHVTLPNKNLDILAQVKQFLKNNQQFPGMAELKARQETILKELAELKKQILSIKSNLKITNIPEPQNATLSTANYEHLQNLQDIVINASPATPPYSLQIIQKLMADSVSLIFTSYFHSTVTSLPESASKLKESLVNFKPNPGVPVLNIRLIWKKIDFNAEMLVCLVPILGEANVLRFLSRVVNSKISYDIDEQSTEIDSLLDISYLLTRVKTKTEKNTLLQTLNKSLGKTQWLAGRTHIGVADIAAFSAIKQCSNSNDITSNLVKWYQRCEMLVK